MTDFIRSKFITALLIERRSLFSPLAEYRYAGLMQSRCRHPQECGGYDGKGDALRFYQQENKRRGQQFRLRHNAARFLCEGHNPGSVYLGTGNDYRHR